MVSLFLDPFVESGTSIGRLLKGKGGHQEEGSLPLMVQQRVRLVEYQSANAPSLSHGCSTDGKQ